MIGIFFIQLSQKPLSFWEGDFMRWKYPILLKDLDQKSKKIYIPDLDIDVSLSNEEIKTSSINEIVKNLIEQKIKTLNSMGYLVTEPRKIKYYEDASLNEYDLIFCVAVDVKQQKDKQKLFGPFLPGLAIVSRIISVGLFAIMTLFAMEITTDNNKAGSKFLNYFIAGCSFLMAMIMFLFSNAAKSIGEIGNKMDNFLFRKKSYQIYQSQFDEHQQLKSSTTATIIKYLSYTGLAGLALIDSVSYGITSSQAIKALAQNLNDNDKMSISSTAIFVLVMLMLLTTSLSALAFDIGFIVDASNMLDNNIDKHFNKSLVNKSQLMQEDNLLMDNVTIQMHPLTDSVNDIENEVTGRRLAQ
jgi:hypothetical protein